MKRKDRIVYLVIALLLSTKFGAAQTCCSGGVPVSGNIGMPFTDVKSFQFNIAYDLNYLNTLISEGEKISESNRRRLTGSYLINGSFSFNKLISLELLGSYIYQSRTIRSEQTETTEHSSGFGDMVMLIRAGKNDLFFPGSSIIVGVGPKIPTGSSSEKNSQGLTFSSDMQPGSGSWDLVAYSSISASVSEKSSARAYIRAAYIGKGSNNNYLGTFTFSSGNEFNLMIGFNNSSYLANNIWNYSIGLRLRSSENDKQNGFILPNTGGKWAYGTMSVGLSFTQRAQAYISGELPVVSSPNGIQLSTSFRLTTGIYINFGKKYSSILIK